MQVAQQDAERSKWVVEKALEEKKSIVIQVCPPFLFLSFTLSLSHMHTYTPTHTHTQQCEHHASSATTRPCSTMSPSLRQQSRFLAT